MDATTLFISGIVAAAALVGIGVFTIAGRRPKDESPVTGRFDRAALQRDRQGTEGARRRGGRSRRRAQPT